MNEEALSTGITQKENFLSPQQELKPRPSRYSQLKARGQDAQIKFLAKLNIVKTTPNFACEFVYVC